MSNRIIGVLVCCYILSCSTARAQLGAAVDHLGSDFLNPQISVGFSAAPDRKFQDIDGTLSLNSATLTATLPVYRIRDGAPEHATSYFLLARGQFTSQIEDISFLPASHTFYASRLGITAGIATTRHHLYLLTFGGGFAEDRRTIGNPRVRATGSLLGKYQMDDSFAFIYGLSYSYTFNRGLVLPLFGIHSSLGENLKLHIVLPFSLDVEYEEATELHFGFLIRANGDQIHIEESGYFGPQSLPLFLKLSQVQAGFSVSIRISNGVWLQGEAGILRNRKFAIGTLDANLVSSGIQNSGYSTFTLRYDLANFESWED